MSVALPAAAPEAVTHYPARASVPGFSVGHSPSRWLAWLMRMAEYVAGVVLAIDVLVVFVSVVFRYFLHEPFDWAEEVARALMIVLVFFGAATVLARSQHVGLDILRGLLPARWQPALIQFDSWIIVAVSACLCVSSVGLLMECNGKSARLIELLLRMFGRVRGGLGLITIMATAFFSGVSGSKLADIADVGGIIMPAVRKTKQDPNETAGLLACTAVMAETIPPCINMIIMGFVANISIAGLFMAGLVPAAVLALSLAAVTIYVGTKINPDEAFDVRTPLFRLLGGAMVALIMVAMIGKGVTSGVATSTEVSTFAVVYALVVGWLAFRELTVQSVIQLFVRSASMAGGILFIVAAASSVSFALTIQQIPCYLSTFMIGFAHSYGSTMFMILSVLIMIVFGAVLEGAPALIIFGPLLTPIASQLGVNPLHFVTVMVIAMGLGLFAPPLGLGLFATCAITGTEVKNVARPMMKYLAVLFVTLILLVLVPQFSLWLPTRIGL